MTLTEKYRSGELKEGWYYIKSSNPNNLDIDYFTGKLWFECDTSEIIEILFPVPAYSQLQEIGKKLYKAQNLLLEHGVLLKGSKLYEAEDLINECREIIEGDAT